MSIRNRFAIALPAVAVMLGVTACATPVAPGPTDPADLEPSPSASRSESAPSASPRAGDAGPDEVDGVRVGEPFAAQTAQIPGFALVEGCEAVGTATRDGYALTVQQDADDADDGEDADDADDADEAEDAEVVLVSASVASDQADKTGPVTAEGIGIGSTVAEALTAYPDAEEVASEGDRRYLRVAEVDDSALFLSYTDGDDVIWALTATSLDAPPYEPCA